MPELPEVETIRRDLATAILNKPIVGIDIIKKRLVRSPIKKFVQVLLHARFIDIDRVGKLLLFQISSGETLAMHLKMTGQLIYQQSKGLLVGGHSFASEAIEYPNQYSYITFFFADNSRLFFNDMRTFGYMELLDQNQVQQTKARYGIEPLTDDFTYDAFFDSLAHRKTSIKAALLNQSIIAGIGNIYADEACYLAGIRPDRSITTLTPAELKKLYQSIETVLAEAIAARGTTFNHFRDSNGNQGGYAVKLQVYGREGQLCNSCKQTKITKFKHASRGTHLCEHCQQ